MARKKSDFVWLRLQLDREMIAFAEQHWWKFACADRDDYINAILLTAMSHEMNEPFMEPPIFNPADHSMPDQDLEAISDEELRRAEQDAPTGAGVELDDDLPF